MSLCLPEHFSPLDRSLDQLDVGALFPEAAGVEPVLVLLHRVQVSDMRVKGAVDGHVVRGEVREVALADEVPGGESG